MAVTRQQVVLEITAEDQGVKRSVDNVTQSVDGAAAATSGLTNQLDKMTGGAITGFKNFASGLKTTVTGLKTFKVALAATGIGLLLVAMGSLVSFFTSTKRGAEQLKVATEALGAAFAVIKDRISRLGGALVKFFTGDFAGALADTKGAFTGITDEIIRETKAAAELQRALNTLKDEERAFNLVRAETNRAIAETRLAVEDETLSFQERIGALERAIALEQSTVDEQLRLARERARIAAEQVGLGESLEEDLNRVQEARIRVIELETASLRTQKRLEGERQSLLLQKQAAEAAAQKAADKALQERLEFQNIEVKEIQRRGLETKRSYELMQSSESILTGIVIDEAEKRKKARQEEFENAVDLTKDYLDARSELTLQAFSALRQLNRAFAGEGEAQARKAFQRNKALSYATAIVNTAQAITDALAKDGTGFPGSRFIAAAAAGVAGAAQVAAIAKTQFRSRSAAPTPNIQGPGTGPGAPTAPQLDLGFLGGGAGQDTLRAYVVAENVSNAQQANQKILDQTTL